MLGPGATYGLDRMLQSLSATVLPTTANRDPDPVWTEQVTGVFDRESGCGVGRSFDEHHRCVRWDAEQFRFGSRRTDRLQRFGGSTRLLLVSPTHQPVEGAGKSLREQVRKHLGRKV